MRLRHTLGAALGTLALLAATPTPASATAGYVTYLYDGIGGKPTFGKITGPDSRVCIEIPEIEAKKGTDAWKFENNTESNVFLFPEDSCGGTHIEVRAGGKADPKFKFRSVYFAHTNT
ncbi:hypothetical protein [Streptomyces sp. MBT27]|uniref:hypothetical protein n=1 Tax=Streptomyces sp. MBT27 TaxID=1488356 RepID=UPI0014220661|nr:hypothetical protein [Streptomyces sp. MBT27]